MIATAMASTVANPVDPELVARFRAALDRLNPSGKKIGLAVSGGPDSLAMLLLAHAAIPDGFEVATVNHGIRAEAADECALVETVCQVRGIPCSVFEVSLAEGNLQSQARDARYAALGDWADRGKFHSIATGHHADDQAETLLMRLNRGSGVAGLAGVRATRRLDQFEAQIIRPLLGFRRSELLQVVEDAGLDYARDPSNLDDRFDRVRMRKALADADWIDPSALAISASNLADAYDALQDYAALLWADHVRQVEGGFVLSPCTSREMNRRLLARIMEQFGSRPRGGDVARLLMRLERGEDGNVGGILARVKADEWIFRPEPPRKSG